MIERTDAMLVSRIDRAVNEALEEKRVVGATAHVARDGVIVAKRAYGLADREQRTFMQENAVFRVASLTKPIVAATALALVDGGVLSLDDQVTRFLPEFRPQLRGEARPITIRQLLTHTSGLSYAFLEGPDGPYHRARVSDGLDQPGLSLEENLARLSRMELAFAPGSAFLYSLSFDVLGAVIERATHQRLPEVVARAVTGPLEMHETAFTPRDPSALATPYADGSPEPVRMHDGIFVPFAGAGATFAPSRALDRASYPSGGAGMVGTGGDFLRFLEALRTRSTIASRASLEAMTRDQIAPIESAMLRDGWGYGFGLAVLRDKTRANSPMNDGAFRWGGAYGHCWFVDPKANISAVLMTNTAFEGMAGRLREDFERAVVG